MNKNKRNLTDAEFENVTGGYTIEPTNDTFWYSFNSSFTYDRGDNWGVEGYFRNN